MTDKKNARILLKKVLGNISEEERSVCAEKARSLILENEFFRRCTSVLSYAPMKKEFDVSGITCAALGLNKKVYLPVISDSGNEMDFYRIKNGLKSENCTCLKKGCEHLIE